MCRPLRLRSLSDLPGLILQVAGTPAHGVLVSVSVVVYTRILVSDRIGACPYRTFSNDDKHLCLDFIEAIDSFTVNTVIRHTRHARGIFTFQKKTTATNVSNYLQQHMLLLIFTRHKKACLNSKDVISRLLQMDI